MKKAGPSSKMKFEIPEASVFTQGLAGIRSHEHATRLRRNAIRAATFVAEIAEFARPARGDIKLDELMTDIGVLFNSISAELEEIRSKLLLKDKELIAGINRERDARVQAYSLELFGDNPDPAEVEAVGKALFAFDGPEGRAWICKHRNPPNGLGFLSSGWSLPLSEIIHLLQSGNTVAASREIGMARDAIPSKGRYWEGSYHAGWSDFEEFRRG